MKPLLKKFLIGLLIFAVSTSLMLLILFAFPAMNDTTFYILMGIYLVVANIGFQLDY